MTGQRAWRESPWQRFQVAFIAGLGYRVIASLCRTLQWRVEGMDHLQRIERAGRYPILAFWHGRVLTAVYYFRDRGIVAMISENFDGEWVARIMERFGHKASRGSTSRGGQRALLQLTRDMASGHSAAFAVDGPRGPARVVQPGVVWLAKLTGNPIVPFHIEARKHWSVRSWDRTQIPKPFGGVALAIGAPIEVTPDASDDMLETKRVEVERALSLLESRTREMLECR